MSKVYERVAKFVQGVWAKLFLARTKFLFLFIFLDVMFLSLLLLLLQNTALVEENNRLQETVTGEQAKRAIIIEQLATLNAMVKGAAPRATSTVAPMEGPTALPPTTAPTVAETPTPVPSTLEPTATPKPDTPTPEPGPTRPYVPPPPTRSPNQASSR